MTSAPLGATPRGGDRWGFVVWAPFARRVTVQLEDVPHPPFELSPIEHGYHVREIEGLTGGTRYWIRLDEGPPRPDPASRWQPEGVHGPSALVDPQAFDWTDDRWEGLALQQYVLYELHVGTFSRAGTFEGLLGHLEELVDLGITAIELMPVAQFPGSRNWGYDGVLPFAVQNTYGGPAGLARLVDAAHQQGLAVVVDVVYNHVGPEGNHLSEFGPYFTSAYRTPWGQAVNLSEPASDEVRRFFIESALWLVRDLHVDGLRLDAVHAIIDPTALPFVEQLREQVHGAADRTVTVVAETTTNDPRAVRPPSEGGWGFDGQWNDDFHHALHVALTGEKAGYYRDYRGVADLAYCLEQRYVLDGRWSEFRGRRHGRPAADIPHHRFVVCSQNHDQVGNRLMSERLAALVPFEALKAAAVIVLLSPFTPLVFMGEEYGETAPFPYFVDHRDPDLVAAVRRGRVEEFAAFYWKEEPPDPAAEETFRLAVLDPSKRSSGSHATLLRLYTRLLELRRELPALGSGGDISAEARGDILLVERAASGSRALIVANLGRARQTVDLPEKAWSVILNTAAAEWNGPVEGRGDEVTRTLALPSFSASLLVGTAPVHSSPG